MWGEILKAGAGSLKIAFVLKHGIVNEWRSVPQILTAMKDTKMKTAGNIGSTQILYILKKLRRQGKIEDDGDNNWKLTSAISKSDWKQMVDNLVEKDTMFEKIYDTLAKKMKFSTPSRSEVSKYLSENYQKHKLWSNLWSKKED